MESERPQDFDRLKKRPPVDPAARAWFMIFVLVLGVGIMIYIDFNRRIWNAPPEELLAGRYWGNPEAELKITQFLDFQSSDVVRGEIMIYEFMQKHPQGVFLQTRYFPQDDKSLLITIYAECANRQKRFRRFTSLLFDRYFQWSALSGVTPIMKIIAGDAGLDMDQLKVCVADQNTAAVITLDRVYGESLFVRSTPTYFLNGVMAVGVDELEKALKIWDEPLMQNE